MIVNLILYGIMYLLGGLFIALGLAHDHSGPVWCGVMIIVCSAITHVMLQIAESRYTRAVTRAQTKYPSSLDKLG